MGKRITEKDEFLLSRLLDGDLPPDESAVVRRRMEHDPELRAAYESLARVDALLAQRGSQQPQVDWVDFHRQVLSRVEARQASATRIIRLPWWVGAAGAVAAAAAVALVVSLYRVPGRTPPMGGGPEPVQVAAGDRPAGEVAPIRVRFNRPAPLAKEASRPIHVTFGRSAQLASRLAEFDQARYAAPCVVLAVPRHPVPPREAVLDGLPL